MHKQQESASGRDTELEAWSCWVLSVCVFGRYNTVGEGGGWRLMAVLTAIAALGRWAFA